MSRDRSRYEMKFLEIGTGKGHVYFLVQLAPAYSPAKNSIKDKKYNSKKGI
jgi:hypothetical protein